MHDDYCFIVKDMAILNIRREHSILTTTQCTVLHTAEEREHDK